ncbi:hypothetical protein CAC42_2233 [Sphaceloma murrayae]|uniref:Uncharacterized protein n=1 Tax=Sphaceloma murrayae TaxID=2082308 RepID=A0A2K1QIL6_9PEZI|nr:hypothetical protein CAC42_2233 [Sphaceloma murrayae]
MAQTSTTSEHKNSFGRGGAGNLRTPSDVHTAAVKLEAEKQNMTATSVRRSSSASKSSRGSKKSLTSLFSPRSNAS